MPRPLVSVVIPTLQRPDTLRFALETLQAQDYLDCEFIVQNNGNDSETEALVRSFDDSRMHHFATSTVLPMTENWEAALSHVNGDLITFIGDDDGLLPDACSLAAAFFSKHNTDILSWSPYWYFWPNYFEESFRNRLLATINYETFAEDVSAHRELSLVYSYEATYDRLPMIYNSFVHRRVITRVRDRLGRYFVGASPDLTSGIVNAAVCDQFARLSRPLSVTGTSKHSTGHLISFSGDEAMRNISIGRDFHPFENDKRLPACDVFSVLLARDLLLLKADMFPDDNSLSLNFKGLIEAIASGVNDHPRANENRAHAIKYLGEAHGIDTSGLIPFPRNERLGPVPGVQRLADNVVAYVIDGNSIGLRTIADAVRLLAGLVPHPTQIDLRSLDQHISHTNADAQENLLQAACDERGALIDRLEADLRTSHANADAQQKLLQAACDERGALIDRMEAELRTRQANSDAQLRILQGACDERVALIDRLDADLRASHANADAQNTIPDSVFGAHTAWLEHLEAHVRAYPGKVEVA